MNQFKSHGSSFRPRPGVLSLLLAAALMAPAGWGQDPPRIDVTNWGALTAPVYGTSEKGVYSPAELFAGPGKFGSYYNGVLPNARIINPAGTVLQVGMNPLGLALTPDGRFLVTTNNDERESGFISLVPAPPGGVLKDSLPASVPDTSYSYRVFGCNSLSVVFSTRSEGEVRAADPIA